MIGMFPAHVPVPERSHMQIRRNLLHPDTPIQPTSRSGIGSLSRQLIDSGTERWLFWTLARSREGGCEECAEAGDGGRLAVA